MNQSQSQLTGTILVIDDTPDNLWLLKEYLTQSGYTVLAAREGEEGMALAEAHLPDLILLDILMPGKDGFEVCRQLKTNRITQEIPVIFMTSLTRTNDKIRGFQLGAVDYITKPYQLEEVLARVNTHLTISDLRASLQEQNEQLQQEIIERQRIEDALRVSQEQSEALLLNVLPQKIVEQLKIQPGNIAQNFDNVSVLFADIVDFSHLSSHLTPNELINLLNDIFSTFDVLAERHGLEKIKTIGDEYMAVGGLPTPNENHMEAIAEMALDMQEAISQFDGGGNSKFTMRIGINSGPVVAGIIGRQKFSYDLWGDTVNVASRMCSHGLASHTQVAKPIYDRLRDQYTFTERGVVQIKGKGEMVTYLLTGRKGG